MTQEKIIAAQTAIKTILRDLQNETGIYVRDVEVRQRTGSDPRHQFIGAVNIIGVFRGAE